jgi:hypothetical protein
MTNALLVLVFLLASVAGAFAGHWLYDVHRVWLRTRRREQLERAVAAELLSRGFTFESMELSTLGGDVPPRVTPEVVKTVADRCELFMRAVHPEEHPDA